MKSEIVSTQEVNNKIEFPWLGIATDGDVILFTQNEVGTVIYCGRKSVLNIGEYSESWNMRCFTEFKGQVILRND